MKLSKIVQHAGYVMTEHQESIRRQYETDEKLRIRQATHDKYTVPDRDFVEWALSCIHWRGDEQVLDLGSGPGLYYEKIHQHLPDVRYTGVDLLPGMLLNHPAGSGALALGDAVNLPFHDDSFDVVMANHMLYHVDDVERAVVEIRRVLKPNGVVMTATNSTQTMPELQVLMRRAIVLLTRQGPSQVRAPSLPSDHFALQNGIRILARHFFAVVRYDMPSALIFPDVEPAMAYLETTRDLRESQLPEDVVWEDVMMIMRQQINQLIKHLGELVINKEVGMLVSTDGGDFIGDYVRRSNGTS